jgi:hypothetical protein
MSIFYIDVEKSERDSGGMDGGVFLEAEGLS